MWRFLTLLAFTLSWCDAIIVRQENSLYGPFQSGAPNLAYWDLSGSAQLLQTFVRLTSDDAGKQGCIWNSYPVLQNDWELHMQFHIHGKHGNEGSGNGMAIWYTKEILQSGSVFGNMDHFTGLGIFIDTSVDPLRPHKHRHPYISAMVNNGSQSYEHNEDGTVHQIGGCHIPIRNLEWPTKIAISYINTVLTVFVDAEGRDQWVQCFRSLGVYLPTHYFFGVSASTGLTTSDNHDIVFITGLDMIQPEKQWEDRSYIIPFAENILVHPRQEEVQKTVEQLQQVEEEQQKVTEKKETRQETKKETRQETKKETRQETKKETRQETKKETPKPRETEPKIDKIPEKQTSLLVKGVYVVGAVVILYVGVTMFKKYRAQRRERIQKRLF